MKSVKPGAGLRAGVFAAMTAGCLVSMVLAVPARADSTADAVKILKDMTDEQIRAELQRRSAARSANPTEPAKPYARPVPAKPARGTEGGEPPTAGAEGGTPTGGSGGTAAPEHSDRITARSFRSGVKPIESIDDATLTTAIRASTRAVYGSDDRREWHQVKDENIRRLARASVAMFRGRDTQVTPTLIRLKTSTLGEDQGLCRGELFAAQSTGAFCSGTLVRDDVVLTAGHCVREISQDAEVPPINELTFVFGYRIERPGDTGPSDLPPENIFKGKTVIKGEFDLDANRDWALVKLDRPVPASIAEPIKAWRKTPITTGDKVFVIGYPNGLPMKYAPNAKVRDTSNPMYFVADLDTFGGNSGSGVYDEATNELAGVLVRGELDFVKDNAKGCMKVNVCPKTCKGEEVTRISLIPAP